MRLTEEEFGARFSGSPVKRAKRRGLLRNVAVALGSWGSKDAVPVLVAALDDEEPLIRGHAAWALGEIISGPGLSEEGWQEVSESLVSRLHMESDPWVEEELEFALRGR